MRQITKFKFKPPVTIVSKRLVFNKCFFGLFIKVGRDVSASYVIDVTVACLFLLLALRTSELTFVACLFRLMFLRTNYVICVACLF